MRHHSPDEITSMVRQAGELIANGQSQAEACKVLGVSVMTFHRWRKAESARNPLAEQAGPSLPNDHVPGEGELGFDQRRMEDLRRENQRLRRLVTDLLLEKMELEERLATPATRSTEGGG